MIDFREPIYQKKYQGRTISIYVWGEERIFLAQIGDEQGHPEGAAPKLYDTMDAAVDVCKDLIDFIYGDVDCYRERPEAMSTFKYSAARQTMLLPHIPAY